MALKTPLDTYEDAQAQRRSKKQRLARLRKFAADCCLQAGSPADAAAHFRAAYELCRAAGDTVWQAAAAEGLAAAAANASEAAILRAGVPTDPASSSAVPHVAPEVDAAALAHWRDAVALYTRGSAPLLAALTAARAATACACAPSPDDASGTAGADSSKGGGNGAGSGGLHLHLRDSALDLVQQVTVPSPTTLAEQLSVWLAHSAAAEAMGLPRRLGIALLGVARCTAGKGHWGLAHAFTLFVEPYYGPPARVHWPQQALSVGGDRSPGPAMEGVQQRALALAQSHGRGRDHAGWYCAPWAPLHVRTQALALMCAMRASHHGATLSHASAILKALSARTALLLARDSRALAQQGEARETAGEDVDGGDEAAGVDSPNGAVWTIVEARWLRWGGDPRATAPTPLRVTDVAHGSGSGGGACLPVTGGGRAVSGADAAVEEQPFTAGRRAVAGLPDPSHLQRLLLSVLLDPPGTAPPFDPILGEEEEEENAEEEEEEGHVGGEWGKSGTAASAGDGGVGVSGDGSDASGAGEEGEGGVRAASGGEPEDSGGEYPITAHGGEGGREKRRTARRGARPRGFPPSSQCSDRGPGDGGGFSRPALLPRIPLDARGWGDDSSGADDGDDGGEEQKQSSRAIVRPRSGSNSSSNSNSGVSSSSSSAAAHGGLGSEAGATYRFRSAQEEDGALPTATPRTRLARISGAASEVRRRVSKLPLRPRRRSQDPAADVRASAAAAATVDARRQRHQRRASGGALVSQRETWRAVAASWGAKGVRQWLVRDRGTGLWAAGRDTARAGRDLWGRPALAGFGSTPCSPPPFVGAPPLAGLPPQAVVRERLAHRALCAVTQYAATMVPRQPSRALDGLLLLWDVTAPRRRGPARHTAMAACGGTVQRCLRALRCALRRGHDPARRVLCAADVEEDGEEGEGAAGQGGGSGFVFSPFSRPRPTAPAGTDRFGRRAPDPELSGDAGRDVAGEAVCGEARTVHVWLSNPLSVALRVGGVRLWGRGPACDQVSLPSVTLPPLCPLARVPLRVVPREAGFLVLRGVRARVLGLDTECLLRARPDQALTAASAFPKHSPAPRRPRSTPIASPTAADPAAEGEEGASPKEGADASPAGYGEEEDGDAVTLHVFPAAPLIECALEPTAPTDGCGVQRLRVAVSATSPCAAACVVVRVQPTGNREVPVVAAACPPAPEAPGGAREEQGAKGSALAVTFPPTAGDASTLARAAAALAGALPLQPGTALSLPLLLPPRLTGRHACTVTVTAAAGPGALRVREASCRLPAPPQPPLAVDAVTPVPSVSEKEGGGDDTTLAVCVRNTTTEAVLARVTAEPEGTSSTGTGTGTGSSGVVDAPADSALHPSRAHALLVEHGGAQWALLRVPCLRDAELRNAVLRWAAHPTGEEEEQVAGASSARQQAASRLNAALRITGAPARSASWGRRAVRVEVEAGSVTPATALALVGSPLRCRWMTRGPGACAGTRGVVEVVSHAGVELRVGIEVSAAESSDVLLGRVRMHALHLPAATGPDGSCAELPLTVVPGKREGRARRLIVRIHLRPATGDGVVFEWAEHVTVGAGAQ